MKKEITFKSLKKFNGFMGVLHLIQAILMLGFAIFIEKIADFQIPIRSYFLTFGVCQASCRIYL